MDSSWGHYLDISDMNVAITTDVDNTKIQSFMSKYVHKIKEEPQKQTTDIDVYLEQDNYLEYIDNYDYLANICYIKLNILRYICLTLNWLFIKN